jgi:hypothetical protein
MKNVSILSLVACSIYAIGFTIEAHADISNVSSIAQSSLNAEARVGYVTPPETIYTDTQAASLGDSAPVVGLPFSNVSDSATAIAASQVAGYVSSRADVGGNIYRTGEIVGDSLSTTLLGGSRIDVQASLYRTRTSSPTNMVAQSVGTVSTTEKVTFTVNMPSNFSATGQLDAFGPSIARAWLVADATGLSLFDYVATQSEYDPSGFSTTEFIDAAASLEPGTYTLWTSSLASGQLEETVLSVSGASPRTRADSRFALSFSVTPVLP